MAEVSFYTDEHVGRAVVSGLSKRGVDVKTAAEAGLLGADDDEHFAFAYNEGRVILTQDADFLILASNGRIHAGIAYAPQGTRVGQLIRGAMLIHQLLSAADMGRRVEFI